MKTIKLLTVCLSLCLLSCNDWLEVRSNDVLLQEEVFSDGDGIRIAVNGIYRQISSRDLYGENLTWGFASLLAQHYQGSYYLSDAQNRVANYDWKHSDLQSITERVWARSYNIIANCNNIIQEAVKKDSSFFVHGQVEKDLILGEMYGIRSLLHFEMLRLFVQAPSTGYTGPAIPYVTVYPTYQPVRLDLDSALIYIVGDMQRACELLAPVDTVAFESWSRVVTHRFKSGQHAASWGSDEFINYRGTRMNYWAARALLARIYMWMGDRTRAYEHASAVYSVHQRGRYLWTPVANQSNNNVDNIHTKRWTEALLAFYDQENYNNYEAVARTSLYSAYYPMFTMKNMADLFGVETNDYRYQGLFRDNQYIVWKRPAGTSPAALEVANYQGPLQTVIRFPEMYHIMIECLMEQQRFAEARDLFRVLKLQRGTNDANIPIDNTDTNADGEGDFKTALINDIIREGLTEGQVFYMFKRLNRNVFNGPANVQMTPEKFTPDYPNNETAYGL
ncbi:MAG: RagB/SusD family nutrient uptake outer membrane protein [Odoribacteraceae bacterium]|jgi:pentatricopeptide repeat protein|nr:RagB/SusD family nutrient uptake outer membrane protein [Odoribacteraceae bacterium]